VLRGKEEQREVFLKEKGNKKGETQLQGVVGERFRGEEQIEALRKRDSSGKKRDQSTED